MATMNDIDNKQLERDVWREQILSAYRAKRFEEVLNMMADNHRDGGDVFSMVENFCSEADPRSKTF